LKDLKARVGEIADYVESSEGRIKIVFMDAQKDRFTLCVVISLAAAP